MNSRAMAAAILQRVRDHGAYSNVLLSSATRELSKQDQAFVYSLVTGALRRQRTIDAIITEIAGRPLDELEPEVRSVLQIAIAELLTDREDTAYATVNESVNAIRQLGKPRAAGLVNGILRRLTREGSPDLPGDKAREFSVPEWVLGKLTNDHGRQTARSLLEGLRAASPGVGVRVRPGIEPPNGAAAVPGIDGAFVMDSVPSRQEGIVISDGASTAVAQAVGARPGERVLDMAAAPGGKTSALWDAMGGSGQLVAADHHPRRLRSARDRLEAMGISVSWVLADGTATPFRSTTFDAVLVDAPCTGLGTLRRRPEIAMRLKAKNMDRIAEQQKQMLEEAWRIVRPGGRIVYSVCTLFAAETIDIVAPYPAEAPEALPGIEWGKGKLLAPHVTGTDGMFVSLLRRPG